MGHRLPREPALHRGPAQPRCSSTRRALATMAARLRSDDRGGSSVERRGSGETRGPRAARAVPAALTRPGPRRIRNGAIKGTVPGANLRRAPCGIRPLGEGQGHDALPVPPAHTPAADATATRVRDGPSPLRSAFLPVDTGHPTPVWSTRLRGQAIARCAAAFTNRAALVVGASRAQAPTRLGWLRIRRRHSQTAHTDLQWIPQC